MIDFLAAVTRWIKDGERLLIFIHMNEHILTGELASMLLSMGLQEATNTCWEDKEPNTHIRGSKPIDGIYHSSNLEIVTTKMLSFHEGVGDHRTTLVDISARSLLGTDGMRISRPYARRLTTSNKKSVTNFIKYVEAQLTKHKLHDRLISISNRLQQDPHNAEALHAMDILDIQTTEILTAGEK
jgi:hypothetical protein